MRILHRPALRGLAGLTTGAAAAATALIGPAPASMADPLPAPPGSPGATPPRPTPPPRPDYPGSTAPRDVGPTRFAPDTGYVRRPYGVMASPDQQDTLPPVDDQWPAEPFDWYRHPRAALGVMGGPEETIVRRDGSVQTAFGTLEFFTGPERTPVDQRVKTWKDGYVPILRAGLSRDGVRTDLEYFAATVEGVTEVPYRWSWGAVGETPNTLTADVENMVNFVAVTLTNTGDSTTAFEFAADMAGGGIGGQGPLRPGSVSWDPDADALVGDGRLLLTASRDPDTVEGTTLGFQVALDAGAAETLVFKMPYFVAQEADATALHTADYGRTRQRVDDFWHRTLDQAGTVIDIPGAGDEDKVLNAYKAAIALSLIDIDIVGEHVFWDANPTVYDRYWLRDSAFNINGILNAGFPEVARKAALNMLDYQRSDGLFMSQPNQWDGNGQALWTFGMYYTRTGDAEFARTVWPAVRRSMDWEWGFRQEAWDEAGGLFPYLFMPDNERVRGHLVGYDLWAIAGERGAVAIAEAVGEHEIADQWRRRADEYESILRDKLAPVVKELGWIPPTIEGLDAPGLTNGWYGPTYGIDWGNLEVAWPSRVFEPDEKWVADSLRAWRGKTFEGLFTYPSGGLEGQLHSYTPMSISDTYVRAGDQGNAVRDLYNLLVHTSATHAATEGLNTPQRWGWSENGETQPHGEFAGKYQTLLRDMLAHEQGGELRLAHTLSPVWTRPGRHVGFDGETDFGRVSYRIDFHGDGARVRLDQPSRSRPETVTIGVPDHVTVRSVTVDGNRVRPPRRGEPVSVPVTGGAMVVDIAWREREAATPLSYPRAVEDFLENYRKLRSPMNLSIGDLRTSRRSVLAGEGFDVTATLTNTGGAGYPETTPEVYLDGQRVDYAFPEISRGIGFTTPREVISFNRHEGGRVRLTYPASICEPGRHTITMRLGGVELDPVSVTVRERPPNSPPPPASLAVDAGQARYLDPGESGEVTATLTNSGCEPLTGADVTLEEPAGWSAEPLTPTTLDEVAPKASGTVRWRLTAPAEPAEVPVVEEPLPVGAVYGWGGDTTGRVEAEDTVRVFAPVTEPHRTFASAEAYFGQAGSRFAIFAGGRDVWRGTNEYGVIYRAGENTERTVVTTRVSRQDPTWPWAKAGIIARADLSNLSSLGYAILVVTPENSVVLQWDSDGDARLDQFVSAAESVRAPVWLRLDREGGSYTGSYSVNGQSWTTIGTVSPPGMPESGDVGLVASAVNVHVPGAISGVLFDGFAVDRPTG